MSGNFKTKTGSLLTWQIKVALLYLKGFFLYKEIKNGNAIWYKVQTVTSSSTDETFEPD